LGAFLSLGIKLPLLLLKQEATLGAACLRPHAQYRAPFWAAASFGESQRCGAFWVSGAFRAASCLLVNKKYLLQPRKQEATLEAPPATATLAAIQSCFWVPFVF
jgi:hypothetical protein